MIVKLNAHMILILSRRRIPASQAGIRLRLMNRNTQYPDIWAKKTRYDSGFFLHGNSK